MKKRHTILILTPIIGLITFVLLTSRYYKNQNKLYEQQLENIYKSRELELTEQLQQAQQDRRTLSDSIVNINRSNKNLRSLDSLKSVQLLQIKGKYQSLTSKQLQDLMIEEFNQNQ